MGFEDVMTFGTMDWFIKFSELSFGNQIGYIGIIAIAMWCLAIATLLAINKWGKNRI